MKEIELKLLCTEKLKSSEIPNGTWKHLKANGYIDAVLSHWEIDPDEAKANLKLLINALRDLRDISSDRKTPPGRAVTVPAYQPTEYEATRQQAYRQFYETNLGFDHRVVSFRAEYPESERLTLPEAGIILTNPLNWLLGSGDIREQGLSPVDDIAVLLRRQHRISTIDDDDRAFYQIHASIPQRNLQFDAYHDVEDRIILQRFHGPADARIIKASESISIQNFFDGHFLKDKIFSEANTPVHNEAIPCFFRKTLLGQCLEISHDLANVHGLDERNILLFLLTGELQTPYIISSSCREIPVFDDDNQLSSLTSAGPVHITVLPQIAKQNVSNFFGLYQRGLLGKDNRPIKNLDLFAFVIRSRADAKRKNEKLDWALLREQWEQSPLSASVGPRTQSVNGFRMAYVNAKKAMFPPIRSKNPLYREDTSDT